MKEQLQTPLEKFEQQNKKVQELLGLGFILPETAERARGKNLKEYKDSLKGRGGMGTGFMSSADFGRRLQESLLQDEESKKQTKALNDIDSKLGDGGPLVKAVKEMKVGFP